MPPSRSSSIIWRQAAAAPGHRLAQKSGATGDVIELVRLSGKRLFALRMQAARRRPKRFFSLVLFTRLALYLRLHLATALARMPLTPLTVIASPGAGAGRFAP